MKKILITTVLILTTLAFVVGCSTTPNNETKEIAQEIENITQDTKKEEIINNNAADNAEVENTAEPADFDVLTYETNGVSFKPTENWKKALADEDILIVAQPATALFMRYIPTSAKEAIAAEDLEKANQIVKNIAYVILDSKELIDANAEALKTFEKNVKTKNGLLVYYNESIDESNLTPEEITETKTLLDEFKTTILPQIQDSTMEMKPSSLQAGGNVSFKTTDMKGNAANSKDLFKEYDITMINLWASYCPPCIKEMPDIEKYYISKPENVNIIGIVTDVGTYDDTFLPEALDIIEKTGATYGNYLASEDMASLLSELNFVPTTIFVDKDGNVIGEPAISALSQSDVEKLIKERLAMIS